MKQSTALAALLMMTPAPLLLAAATPAAAQGSEPRIRLNPKKLANMSNADTQNQCVAWQFNITATSRSSLMPNQDGSITASDDYTNQYGVRTRYSYTYMPTPGIHAKSADEFTQGRYFMSFDSLPHKMNVLTLEDDTVTLNPDYIKKGATRAQMEGYGEMARAERQKKVQGIEDCLNIVVSERERARTRIRWAAPRGQ